MRLRPLSAVLLGCLVLLASHAARADERAFPCAENDRACLLGLLDAGQGGEPLRAALLLSNFADEPTARALAARLPAADQLLATAAVHALVRIGTPAVAPLLDATKSENEAVRAYAVYALGRIGQGVAVDQVADLALDPSSEVRLQLATALGEWRGAGTFPLLKQLADDHVIRVRAAAVGALGGIDDPAAVGLLAYALTDPYPAVGNEAVRAIARKGRAAVVPLQQMLTSTQPAVIVRACVALAWIGEPGANMALVRVLANSDPRAVQAAIYALAATGDRLVVRALQVLREPARKVDGVTLSDLARDAIRRIQEREKKAP